MWLTNPSCREKRLVWSTHPLCRIYNICDLRIHHTHKWLLSPSHILVLQAHLTDVTQQPCKHTWLVWPTHPADTSDWCDPLDRNMRLVWPIHTVNKSDWCDPPGWHMWLVIPTHPVDRSVWCDPQTLQTHVTDVTHPPNLQALWLVWPTHRPDTYDWHGVLGAI